MDKKTCPECRREVVLLACCLLNPAKSQKHNEEKSKDHWLADRETEGR